MDGYVARQALQDIADAIREKNGSSDTYKPSEMAEAILDLRGSINLQDKQVIITENGTTTIVADEDFYGLRTVNVISNIYESEFDWSIMYSNSSNYARDFIREKIELAKKIQTDFVPKVNLSSFFADRTDIVFVPLIDTSMSTNFYRLFYNCTNLQFMPNEFNTSNATTVASLHWSCGNLIKTADVIDTANATNINHIIGNCTRLKRLKLTSIENITSATESFVGTRALEELEFDRWKKTNISLSASTKLLPSSVHYIIQNAMSIEDGATARTLTLNATAKTNWAVSEYYEQDLAVLEEKGITIA